MQYMSLNGLTEQETRATYGKQKKFLGLNLKDV